MSTASDMAEIMAAIDELKPVIEKALPTLFEVGVLIKPVIENICDLKVEMTHRMITNYIGLDYSKEEAFALTMSDMKVLTKNLGK